MAGNPTIDKYRRQVSDWTRPAKVSGSGAASDVVDLAKGIYQTVRHPIQTAENVVDLGAGAIFNGLNAVLPPKVAKFLQGLDDPKYVARATALANDFGGQMRSQYGSSEALRKSILEHPVRTAADLSSLLTGGELVASRIAPKVAKSLGDAARVTNPFSAVSPIAARLPGSKPLVRAVTRAAKRTAPVVDDAGNLTPAAHAAIVKSGLDPALFDKGLTDAWADLAKTKGVSPESARQALLAHTGAPTVTRAMTTGQKPTAALGDAGAIAGEARQGVAQRTAAAGPTPTPGAVGQSFIESGLAAKNAIQQNYNKAAAHAGVFDPETVRTFYPTVEGVLKDPEFSGLGLPSTPEGIQRSGYMPLTSKVLFGERGASGLIDGLSDLAENTRQLDLSGDLPTRATAPDTLTMGGIESMRRKITHAWSKATGDDIAGLKALQTALDKWQAEHIENGGFSGNGEAALADLGAARKSFVDFKRTFEDNPNSSIRSAWGEVNKHLVDTPEGAKLGPTAPSVLPEAVQDVLAKGVSKPGAAGVQTYEQLAKPTVEGGPTPLTDEGVNALHDELRSSVHGGALGTQELEQHLTGPYGHLFDPDQQAALRQSAAANDLLNAKPSAPSSLDTGNNKFKTAALATLGGTLGTGAGAVISHAVPALPPGVASTVGGIAGSAIGAGLSSNLAQRSAASRTAAELAGAPAAYESVAMPAASTPALLAAQAGKVQGAPGEAPSDDKAPPGPLTDEQTQAYFKAPTPEATETPLSDDQIQDFFKAKPTDDKSTREGRASGGSVSEKTVEHLVRRLMHKAKHARKMGSDHTEGLLKHDDSTIVAALNAAKQAL